jgi:hypothetical protein
MDPAAATRTGSPVVALAILGAAVLMVLGYRMWRVRRSRWTIARAYAEGLVDPDFSDRDVLENSREQLRGIEGQHAVREYRAVGELFGQGAANWILENAGGTESDYRIDVIACDVIRVLDHGEEGATRLVVRVDVRISVARFLSPHLRAVAYWTFLKRDHVWTRTAVEDQWAGRRHLKHDPLSTPEADLGRLRDRAVLAEASGDTAPAALAKPAGTVVGRAGARAAALDLSLIDRRYELDVIKSCMNRILAAWDLATNGEPTALDPLTTPQARRQLLKPARGLPSALREPRLRKLKLVELDADAEPPTVTLLATVQAHPDIWHLDICWRLALTPDGEQPWTLNDARAWKDSYSFSEHR